LVGFWVAYSRTVSVTGVELFTDIFRSIGTALSAVVQAFGNIVLIFAILQWALPEFKFPSRKSEWNPRSLKAISQPDRIKRGEIITEIFFTLVGLIIFNFYLDRVGIYMNINGQWTFTSILTSAFNPYIVWFDIIWVLTIIQDVLLLRKGAWETATRIFAIVLSGLNIALAASLISNIQYLYTLQGVLGLAGLESTFKSLLNGVLIFAFVIVIIVNAVKIVQMVWRLITHRSPGQEIPPVQN
jgi:hypothetical protein